MPRDEVADLHGVDGKTIDRWAKEGLIPSRVTPGGQRRYVRAEMLADAEKRYGFSEFSSRNDDLAISEGDQG